MIRPAIHPKREIALFLAILFLLSSVFYGLLLFQPGAAQRWDSYSLAFMWCPGMAALLTLSIMRHFLRGLGWGWGGFRYYAIAYFLPIAICLAAYAPVWIGFHAFRPEGVHESAAKLGLPAGATGQLALALIVLAQPFLGMIGACGEELGWRGFLVPQLHAMMGFTKAGFLTGLIWAIWHFPVVLVVFPFYRPSIPVGYALACFCAIVVAMSFVHSWLRLRSGSVWPSVLFHAAGNAFLGSFQTLTREDARTAWLTFEYGLALALVMLPVGFAFWKAWQTRAFAPDGLAVAPTRRPKGSRSTESPTAIAAPAVPAPRSDECSRR